jgi:hypothetical protein
MDDVQKRKAGIAAGIIAAVAVVLLMIPMDYWMGKIPSGRMVSEGEVVSVSSSSIKVRIIYTQPERYSDNYLVLQGDVLDEAHKGQRVRIGYNRTDGLFEDMSQTVVMEYRVSGNALQGLVLSRIMPGLFVRDLRIADVQLDGSLIPYSVAS